VVGKKPQVLTCISSVLDVSLVCWTSAAARLVGADPALVQCAAAPAADPYPCHIADTHQLRACGWQATCSLEQGLRQLVMAIRA